MAKVTYTLAELSDLIGAKLEGDSECKITDIAPIELAQANEVTFLKHPRYRKYLKTTQASAVILNEQLAKYCKTNKLITDHPHLGYAKVATLFQYPLKIESGIHNTALIGKNCKIHPSVSVGARCVIGDNVNIGENTVIHPGCIIGPDISIGHHCVLWPNVTIYHYLTIGHFVTIHAGAVIGSDGFGNVKDDKGLWCKIPQIGSVIIGNHVDIGANTTIDRGSLKNTVIEDYVKLDNLIQIAHNVHIGMNTAVAACAAIAGSTHIGKNCMIGGGARIADNIKIVDNVMLFGSSTVPQSITKPGIYGSGTPLMPRREILKTILRYQQLDEMAKRISNLENLLNESA